MNSALKNVIRRMLPRRIKAHRILAGPLRGRVIVASWYDYPAAITGRTEKPLLAWFRANVARGETWLDIGAHYGYTALALGSLVGPEGRVFAFEPMLATAGHLAQTRDLNRLPQITVLPFALGSEAGISVAELPTTRGMVDSTLAGQVASERFLSSSLDFLWPQVARKNLTMSGVKMDVQGMELDVLSGMSETIRRHRPKLVVEIHAGVDRSSFLELIASYGYSKDATPIEPVPGETAAAFVDNRSYAFSMA